MAVRKHLTHDEQTRNRIKTSQLVNRLHQNAFGEIELTQGQIKSIDILLKKALPDLQAVTHNGNVDLKVVGEVVFRGLNG